MTENPHTCHYSFKSLSNTASVSLLSYPLNWLLWYTPKSNTYIQNVLFKKNCKFCLSLLAFKLIQTLFQNPLKVCKLTQNYFCCSFFLIQDSYIIYNEGHLNTDGETDWKRNIIIPTIKIPTLLIQKNWEQTTIIILKLYSVEDNMPELKYILFFLLKF